MIVHVILCGVRRTAYYTSHVGALARGPTLRTRRYLERLVSSKINLSAVLYFAHECIWGPSLLFGRDPQENGIDSRIASSRHQRSIPLQLHYNAELELRFHLPERNVDYLSVSLVIVIQMVTAPTVQGRREHRYQYRFQSTEEGTYAVHRTKDGTKTRQPSTKHA